MPRFAFLAFFLAVLVTGPTAQPSGARSLMVVTVQNRGKITIELQSAKAPNTTAHVAKLAESKFYDGQKFFKVVKKPRPFLIQTGDPGSRTKSMDDPSLGTGGSGKTVPFEDSGLPNVEGAVGLSTRPNDRDSGDSQFYILLGPARFLDGSYTVFGRVIEGMDVVRAVELGDVVVSVTIVRG
ncbi:MAG: peptidylprolyl isomerase [Fimbriimonadaceae bacterium]|nr:peptidylprolyl isomerase [Fimbriimonadaceae bacterium]QYK58289.1 MAG: peptidylprolyl isomerase [Fimbriimonadaceae bacterium]